MSALPAIRLEPVTAANWKAVLDLELAEGQERFVEPNAYSLAESKFMPSLKAMAIYAGDELVGFTLYGYDTEHSSYAIQRLMIDRRLQGKGYGRAAMVEIIDRLKAVPGCREIFLAYQPDNAVGEHIYASLGFVPTGEIVEYGSVLAKLTLPDERPPQAERVELRPITEDNYKECLRLFVALEQESFVAENVFSLAQALIFDSYVPLAIYDGERMVGFVMYGFEAADGRWWVRRLMVDAPLQGRGYGRLAMLEVIEILKQIPGCTEAALRWAPENVKAGELYRRLGFVETGEIIDGQIIARKPLRPD